MKTYSFAAVLLSAACATALAFCRCGKTPKFTGAEGEVHLITLDPGHFHAALVQKVSYPQVDRNVCVYAPQGDEVAQHLALIASYNNRSTDPTQWNEIVYTGGDFLQRMLDERRGNVVVLAGRNGAKTDYIYRSVSAGLNVLSDKPMAIDGAGFQKLLTAFDKADKKGVLLYDIMTERYEATNAIQRELARMPELIGAIDKGTPDDPAVIQESIHYFAKVVSGAPLIRPEWYFDTAQQGEGIVDATTHLIDLVQLTVVGEKPINYKKDIRLTSAGRWQTPLSRAQYRFVTGKDDFATFLTPYVANDTLKVYANGRIDYTLNGINVRVTARWDYMAPPGSGDNEYAVVRGQKGSLTILQGAEQGYKPMLYAEAAAGQDTTAFGRTLRDCVARLASGKWPGVEVVTVRTAPASGAAPAKGAAGAKAASAAPASATTGAAVWQVVIPAKYDVGHEAHFGQVTQNFLRFLVEGRVPDWEVAGMKAKYFITTSALQMALAAGGAPAK